MARQATIPDSGIPDRAPGRVRDTRATVVADAQRGAGRPRDPKRSERPAGQRAVPHGTFAVLGDEGLVDDAVDDTKCLEVSAGRTDTRRRRPSTVRQRPGPVIDADI